jgi:hypothetical protein
MPVLLHVTNGGVFEEGKMRKMRKMSAFFKRVL